MEILNFDLFPVDGRKSFYNKAHVVGNMEVGYTLLSYGTPVMWFNGTDTIIRNWSGYSATTMRHVNSFMRFCGTCLGGKRWWDSLPVETPVKLVSE